MGIRSGIVKYPDSMGRILIPKDMREFLGIERNDEGVELTCEGKVVIMRKYEPGCLFCGSISNRLKSYQGKQICPGCIKDFLEHFEE
jgi:transcriptional pleiotropic regulator of transition state genes